MQSNTASDSHRTETVRTCVIRPNKVTELGLRRCGVPPAAPVAFSVRWRRNSNVDAFDNQYDKTSLLSWLCRKEVGRALLH